MEGSEKRWWHVLRNEEKVFAFFCSALMVSYIFWTLLNSILSLLFLAYWIFFSEKEFSWKSARSRWVILFCLLYFMTVVGCFYSANMKHALFKLQQRSAFLLFPVIFGTVGVLSTRLLRNCFRSFTSAVLAGCVVCFAKGVYDYLKTGHKESLFGYDLVILRDMTPYTFSLCCLLAILFLLHTLYLRKKHQGQFRSSDLVELVMALAILFSLLVFGNRNILMITFGICIFYGISVLSRIRHKIWAGLVIIAIFAGAIRVNPFLNRQWNELTDFSSQNTIQLDKDASLGRSWGGKQLRLAIWKCSMDVIRRHWFSGVGTGDAQDSLQAAYEQRKFYFASRYNRYNTHNQYLQEFVTYGIIGLLIFVVCLAAPFFVKFTYSQRQFYWIFLLAFALACITDTPLDLNKGIIWYAFFNALIFFTYYNYKFKSTNGNAQPEF